MARLTLGAYMARTLTDPPAHCGDFLAGWIEAGWGLAPDPSWRGLSPRAWLARLKAESGLHAVLRAEARRLGAPSVRPGLAPRGSAGIVLSPVSNGRARPVCAIRAGGDRWLVWGGPRDGVIGARLTAVASWRRPHA